MTEQEKREREIEELQRNTLETIPDDPWDLKLFYHHRRMIASVLYRLGYRKIPNGTMVLLVGKENQALSKQYGVEVEE